jgi:hypothetical protein
VDGLIENAIIFRVVDEDVQRTVFGIYLPPRRTVRVTALHGAADGSRATPIDELVRRL